MERDLEDAMAVATLLGKLNKNYQQQFLETHPQLVLDFVKSGHEITALYAIQQDEKKEKQKAIKIPLFATWYNRCKNQLFDGTVDRLVKQGGAVCGVGESFSFIPQDSTEDFVSSRAQELENATAGANINSLNTHYVKGRFWVNVHQWWLEHKNSCDWPTWLKELNIKSADAYTVDYIKRLRGFCLFIDEHQMWRFINTTFTDLLNNIPLLMKFFEQNPAEKRFWVSTSDRALSLGVQNSPDSQVHELVRHTIRNTSLSDARDKELQAYFKNGGFPEETEDKTDKEERRKSITIASLASTPSRPIKPEDVPLPPSPTTSYRAPSASPPPPLQPTTPVRPPSGIKAPAKSK